MALHIETEEEDTVITLTAEESWSAFDEETRHRLGLAGNVFIAQWRAGEIDRDDPRVRWLISLLPSAGALNGHA
jgi:hypothetical protein